MRWGQPAAGARLAAAGLAVEVRVLVALAGAFERVEPAALHAGHGLERGAAAELAHEARADLGLAIALVLADAFGIVDGRCADARGGAHIVSAQGAGQRQAPGRERLAPADGRFPFARDGARVQRTRSEEHTSELQSLMSISYAVFCL